MPRLSKRSMLMILCGVTLLVSAFLGMARYLSPTAWPRIATSPSAFVATVIAYRQLCRITSEPDQRKLWNYEVAFEAAPPGQLHVVYVPRLLLDDNNRDPRYPGRHLRVLPGIETHVIMTTGTFEVLRSYVHD